MGKESDTGTPYDDVCRTMLSECDDLVLPLINEIFGEHFSSNDRIIRRANEHFLEAQGGTEKKRISDGLLSIESKELSRTKNYHIECESTKGNDGTLLIRIFEYASQIALDDGSVETENNDSESEVTLTVDFPHSAVICLRSRKKTAQKWSIRMRTLGGECCYQVPVIYIKKYGIEEMFRKKLYFLIPFYIFNMEAEL